MGDKLGYLMATVEYALKREDLSEPFKRYLLELVDNLTAIEKEAAVTKVK